MVAQQIFCEQKESGELRRDCPGLFLGTERHSSWHRFSSLARGDEGVSVFSSSGKIKTIHLFARNGLFKDQPLLGVFQRG